ncbi:MAG: GNAT family N-acetyltransferase [Leptolyngbya sp. SIOISBB]|nr:GNAT family N-acetyltransferase [Leptolyngbya sp. SIOISBB]
MTAADAAAVIALNQAVVEVTSAMGKARFAELTGLSSLKLVAETNGEVVAFVLAMSEGQAYDNGNYQWFSARLKNFLYIDRVVVSAACQGFGIGRLLYSHLNTWARQVGILSLCGEIDIEPPNPASLRFHEKAGFVPIGKRSLASGKQVSMQLCVVTEPSSKS